MKPFKDSCHKFECKQKTWIDFKICLEKNIFEMLIGRNNRIGIVKLCFSFPGIGNIYNCIPFLCTHLSLQELHLFCGVFCPTRICRAIEYKHTLAPFLQKAISLTAKSFLFLFDRLLISCPTGTESFYVCQRGKYKMFSVFLLC